VAGLLGGDGIVSGGGVAGGGVAGCDAVSDPNEASPPPSSCGMVHIHLVSVPLCPLVGSAGCRLFRFRLAWGAGRDGVVPAPSLPAVAVATTSFLAAERVRLIAASAAARGAAVVGSVTIAASQ
jgi:hypothetical protein